IEEDREDAEEHDLETDRHDIDSEQVQIEERNVEESKDLGSTEQKNGHRETLHAKDVVDARARGSDQIAAKPPYFGERRALCHGFELFLVSSGKVRLDSNHENRHPWYEREV